MKNAFLKSIAFVVVMFSFLNFSFFQKKNNGITIGFYNVENLFDTINDPNTIDEDFTPNGKNKWNTPKYKIKLENLSKVIASLDEGKAPAVVGMAEIENKTVLTDLINASHLKNKKYGIIHRNSKDERGIDVAAIYRTDVLSDVKYEYLEVKLTGPEEDYTRDILYIKGNINKKYPIHIFYNHWPSRREGEEESEPKRIAAAKTLKNKINSIQKTDANASILILGDFNDEPKNKSINEILGAGKESDNAKLLVNLSYKKFENGEGTHNHQGDWNMLDQIIASRSLVSKTKGLILKSKETFIFKPEWVLFKHKDGNVTPSKSYSGPTFHKTGYSDHLAIYTTLVIAP